MISNDELGKKKPFLFPSTN